MASKDSIKDQVKKVLDNWNTIQNDLWNAAFETGLNEEAIQTSPIVPGGFNCPCCELVFSERHFRRHHMMRMHQGQPIPTN